MKVAITGISGYLGQLLAARLDADSRVESIVGLDIAEPAFRSPKVAFCRADLLRADLGKLLAGTEVLYHLAFIVSPTRSYRYKELDRINVDGSNRVFSAAVSAGVQKIIYTSSIAAYGAHPDNPPLIEERCPLRPNQDWYYSRAKGRVERILDDLQKRRPELVIIRLRPSIFVGPSINNPLGKMLQDRLLVSTYRSTRLALCWDEDVVEALALALGHARSDLFNIAGDGSLTMEDIGELLDKRVVHLPPDVVRVGLALARRLGLTTRGMVEWLDVALSGSIVISAEKAKRELSWRPRFDAAGALVEYARRANGRGGRCTGNG
ncbi:MAG: NAD-dependent epimerase/dehydratase family protein [Bradymonadales bacterium]|nr:NAD-dependent epimerase/dehydratase family protein [Bradymonadales bacterium]